MEDVVTLMQEAEKKLIGYDPIYALLEMYEEDERFKVP